MEVINKASLIILWSAENELQGNGKGWRKGYYSKREKTRLPNRVVTWKEMHLNCVEFSFEIELSKDTLPHQIVLLSSQMLVCHLRPRSKSYIEIRSAISNKINYTSPLGLIFSLMLLSLWLWKWNEGQIFFWKLCFFLWFHIKTTDRTLLHCLNAYWNWFSRPNTPRPGNQAMHKLLNE